MFNSFNTNKNSKNSKSAFFSLFEEGKVSADAAGLKPVFRGMMDVETN